MTVLFLSRRYLMLLPCLLWLATPCSLSQGTDLLREDFEGIPLQPVVTFESELREREAWQTVGPNGPVGWTEENNTTSVGDPESGVLEFEGWRFVDKQWWTNTAGDQDRSQFVNGIGIVAVADPDEWDDFGDPDQGSNGDLLPENGVFDSTLKTPALSIAAAGGDPIKLSFSSSWKDEDLQTATLTAVYDTGEPEVLDVWTSVNTDSTYKPDGTNEQLTYDLQAVPGGATEVSFEFRLQGNNDWWWAIDNIQVFTGEQLGEDGVLRAVIDRGSESENGLVKIVNNTGQTVELRGYSIRSQAGVLDEAGAQFLSASDSDWLQATQPGGEINDLSEVHVDYATFGPVGATSGDINGEINLGDVWTRYFEDSEDITFEYLVEGSDDPIQGIIQVTGNDGMSFGKLDLNFDGDVNHLDWETFRIGFGTDLTDKPRAVRYKLGDLDNDNLHTLADFIEFQRQFDLANGSGAFEAMLSTVPEPSALLACLVAAVGLVGVRRARAGAACLALAIGCLGISQSAEAQVVLLDEDFENSVDLGPFIEEDVSGSEVWTNVPPTGWATDNSGVPGIGDPDTDGIVDWSNWAFVDKDAWISADNQGRSMFDRGVGNVMVADPDEWDDDEDEAIAALRDAIASEPTPDNLYDVFATTPVMNIPSAVPAGRIKFSFDSSWRGNEFQDDLDGNNNQRATITAIYDGTIRKEILTWDSNEESDNFNPNAENQHWSQIDLEFDGSASTVQLEFAMTDAWNDWWWAVDNLLVEIPTDPLKLKINTYNGQAFVTGDDVLPSELTGINIVSDSGQLLEVSGGLSGAIQDVADGPDPGNTAGDTPGEQWEQLTSGNKQFAEAFQHGSSTFDINREELLGLLQNGALLNDDPAAALAASDLEFTYSLETGTIVTGVVEYFYQEVEVGLPGDFNNDNVVDSIDYAVWRENLGSPTEAVLGGNGTGDGVVDQNDFNLWLENYGNSLSPAADTTSSTPEPTSVLILLLAACGGAVCRSCRVSGRGLALLLVASVSVVVSSQEAKAADPPTPWLDRVYRFGEDDAGGTAGQPVSQTDTQGNLITFDDAGQPGMNQLIDLIAVSPISRKATYVDTSDRPDGNGGIGLRLNQLTFDRQYLRTGFGEALNNPEQSPSSLASLVNPGGTLNYFRINDRGFELWAKPSAVTGEHHIVMDSQQHGVLINADGNIAMRYGSKKEVEYEQLPGPDEELGTEDDIFNIISETLVPANYESDVQAQAGEWYHLSVVRPSGPGNGSILYVNGVAEAIAFGSYSVETIVNIGEGEVFTNIDSLDTSPLTVGRATTSVGATGFDLPVEESYFFRGVVDDLSMFVVGLNDNDNVPGGGQNVLNDYGEYLFGRDNGWAQAFAPSVDGDLNGDDAVTNADAQLFVMNWLFENRLSSVDPLTEIESSRLVGDINTRSMGDFNYDGIINLKDWGVLNSANPSAGALALRLLNGAPIPEPASFVLVASLAFAAGSRVNRGRCSMGDRDH